MQLSSRYMQKALLKIIVKYSIYANVCEDVCGEKFMFIVLKKVIHI